MKAASSAVLCMALTLIAEPVLETAPLKAAPPSSDQSSTLTVSAADWPMYNHDLAGWRFNSAEKTLGPANVCVRG